MAGGRRIAGSAFEVEPVHTADVRMINGNGYLEYDVACRFRISVMVEVRAPEIRILH